MTSDGRQQRMGAVYLFKRTADGLTKESHDEFLRLDDVSSSAM